MLLFTVYFRAGVQSWHISKFNDDDDDQWWVQWSQNTTKPPKISRYIACNWVFGIWIDLAANVWNLHYYSTMATIRQVLYYNIILLPFVKIYN